MQRTHFMPARFPAGVLLAFLAIAPLLAGCARYRYYLVEPATAAQQVTKQGSSVEMPPITYQLHERQRRLMIAISNPGDGPVRLDAPRSYVVDPRGETHPFGGGTIAPRSYITLGLPPEPPVYRSTPTFSVGLGVGYRSYHSPYGYGPGYHGWGVGDPWLMGPTYSSPINLQHYWDWKRGTVRLHLSYDGGGTNAVEHDLLFERRREEKK